MTARQKLLVSLLNLESTGLREFSESEIVIQAWTDWCLTYGMRGHHYPDSKRVSTELVQAVKHKVIARVRPRTYALTDWGRSDAARAKQCSASA